ncbi:MAG TPA: hypothetical protein VGM50_00420 [Gemmatimonadaceae bacterium]
MAKPNENQPGAKAHGEGQHGDKTHEAIIESLHGKHGGTEDEDKAAEDRNDFDEFGQPKPGHHRLVEGRQQHDAAEKDSETNRLSR